MKKVFQLLLFISFFTLFGCNNFLECLTNKEPEIHNVTFRRGEVGIYYYEEVTTEINNEPRDNDYDYYYRLLGQLPPGIEMFVNYRTVSFEGIPEEAGRYTFTLVLTVDPPVDFDGFQEQLCNDTTSRDFSIIIGEGDL